MGVLATLRCAQGIVVPRQKSLQLLGFDLLVAEDLSVWLLEINSSPSMASCTPITQRLVPEVSSDLAQMIHFNLFNAKKNDHPLVGHTHPAEANRDEDDLEGGTSYGKFKLLFKAEGE